MDTLVDSSCGFWFYFGVIQYSDECLYVRVLVGDLLGIYQWFSTGVNLPLGDIPQCLETSVVVTPKSEPLPNHISLSQPLSLSGFQCSTHKAAVDNCVFLGHLWSAHSEPRLRVQRAADGEFSQELVEEGAAMGSVPEVSARWSTCSFLSCYHPVIYLFSQ